MEDFNLQEHTAKIEAAIEAADFDQAVELVNAIPEGEIAEDVKDQALKNIEEARIAATSKMDSNPPEEPKADEKPEEKPEEPKAEESKDPEPEKAKEAVKLSKDFNSKNAIKALKDIETKEDLDAFLEGEERKTVLETAKVRAQKLAIAALPETSKKYDIQPAIEKVKELPTKEAITAFIVEETRAEVVEAAMAAGAAIARKTEVPAETKNAVDYARKKGFHDKMKNLALTLPAENIYRAQILEESEAMAATIKNPKSKHHLDRGVKPGKKAKPIKAEEVIEDWEELLYKIIRFEAQQKLTGRPYRHILTARNQLEVRLGQFKRNCR